jgi:hypothetical protein
MRSSRKDLNLFLVNAKKNKEHVFGHFRRKAIKK